MLQLPDTEPLVDLAVFGGSGLYRFAQDLEPHPIDTPYGPTSAVPMVGRIGGRSVAFLPRHGIEHTIPAHRVNYRANVWAVAALGARALIAPFACGSLRSSVARGDLVIVDQLIDRTHSRNGTFFDGPETFHVSLADPYHRSLGAEIGTVARRLGLTVHDTGTVVVIPGPRFSTRAESEWHARMGWDLVNMTQAPEAALAAEAGVAYVGLGLVTDYDVGVENDASIAAVSQEDVFAFLEANASHVRALLHEAIPLLTLPETGDQAPH